MLAMNGLESAVAYYLGALPELQRLNRDRGKANPSNQFVTTTRPSRVNSNIRIIFPERHVSLDSDDHDQKRAW